MIPARDHGLGRPSRPPIRDIVWTVRILGLAMEIVARHTPVEWLVYIPANDTDRFRW